ncbi:MAG: ATP-dependent protease subunit HslV [Eubacteriaceae bacterium]|nr:ATP-dependent protease subunit HslV [Eubacteriaceae bacterium]MBQ1466302.1 ATP-dependent protease subunit HslV [Eubacteriaceae bacterium]MBR2779918.1 ATP-dependent protease subunit HslV [Eubacteriaceae bacterium]
MFRATTILAVKRNNRIAIGGDGQVTLGETTIMKHTAEKVRTVYNGKVAVGFAGSVADAFTLSDMFEGKLEQYSGNIQRAAIELAKQWRTDAALRKLDALLIACDRENVLIVSGTGEVIEPDDGVASIGSGSMYAMAAARALVRHSDMEAKDIVRESLKIASEICVYTNDNIKVIDLEELS